jgi:hypothetical protein
MSQISNFVDVKNQIVTVSVDSNVSNYQTKVFFNGSIFRNLRSKIITALQVWTDVEVAKVDGLSVVDVTNTDFSTYLTLVGLDGKTVINLLPLTDLYSYRIFEQDKKNKQLRQFLIRIDWEKSFFTFIWNASPIPGSCIAMKVSYVDNVSQLPPPLNTIYN